MKIASLLFLTFFAPWTNQISGETDLLDFLLREAQISSREYNIFKGQIAFKKIIGTNKRLDSLTTWNLDIAYTEEFYYQQEDSFLVKEYYFSSKEFEQLKKENKLYWPHRYYENGVLKSKYFFLDKEGKEHLQSILDHMNKRKQLDEIIPLAKIEVVHAGCGMTWKYMESANEKAKKQYSKARTPDYFATETLYMNSKKKISFQRPVKAKFKVIVEGHSF